MGRLLLVVAVALVGCLLTPFTSAGARPLRTAIVDPWAFEPDVSKNPAFGRAKRTGATYVKILVDWRSVAPPHRTSLPEPRNPFDEDYDWLRTTRQVEGALDAGLRPFLYVYDMPDWARARRGYRPRPEDLGDFFAALARRYPKVDHFQVWNEPNYAAFLTPQFNRREAIVSAFWYKRMVNAASAAVHTFAPDRRNFLIAGGTGPHARGVNSAPLSFMRKMLCLRRNLEARRSCRPAKFDIWAHHPYTSGDPTHHASRANDVSLGDLGQMRRVLRAAVRGGKIRTPSGSRKRNVAFWVTEFSWDTRPEDPRGVPRRLHARWVSEALYRMWQARVSVVTWFKLQDGSRRADSLECYYQSGFYKVSGRRKYSRQAFRFPFVAFASRHRNRVRVWGRTPDSTATRVVIQRRTRSGWHRVATVEANRVGIFGKTLRRPWKAGTLRARADGQHSRRFGLRRPRDRYVNPFGSRTCL